MAYKISEELVEAFFRRIMSLGFTLQRTEEENNIGEIYKQDTCYAVITKKEFLVANQPETKETAWGLSRMFADMRLAHHLYHSSPALACPDLECYRLISEFGDTLLAAKMSKDCEVRFVTWNYDYDHKGVFQGNYFETNFHAAKRDFAIRAGLIAKRELLTKEEVEIVYEACIFRGEHDETLDYEKDRQLREVAEKLEDIYPEITVERESDQNAELERGE